MCKWLPPKAKPPSPPQPRVPSAGLLLCRAARAARQWGRFAAVGSGRYRGRSNSARCSRRASWIRRTLGSGTTHAHGINNSGQIVGYYIGGLNSTDHGALYSNGSFIDIDFPGTFASLAWGINNAGDIVGQYYQSLTGGL